MMPAVRSTGFATPPPQPARAIQAGRARVQPLWGLQIVVRTQYFGVKTSPYFVLSLTHVTLDRVIRGNQI